MDCTKKTNALQKLLVIVFIVILLLPVVMKFASEKTGKKLDVELLGYTDTTAKPAFTLEGFLTGGYQSQYTSWYEEQLKLRGVLTKNYSSIRYHLFNLGNRPIGYHNDIFENSYIDQELCINGYPDMSLEENQIKMREYVENLEILQEKLLQYDKYLYVYMPSTKARVNYENIPQKYKGISSPTSVSSPRYFDYLMRQTSIPYLNCDEMIDELEYPAFYTTGIHLSRTFEQKISHRILQEISEVANKRYRNFTFDGVEESNIPFWRDTDVFDLQNTWNTPEENYYQYIVKRSEPSNYDRLKILLHGTSFIQGLRKDILDIYSTEEVCYVNRRDYLLDSNGLFITLNNDWNSISINEYLDGVDIVVLEVLFPADYSFGFVDHLLKELDDYVPIKNAQGMMENLDANADEPWDTSLMKGFYGREEGFVWSGDCCKVVLQNPRISETGLQLDFAVSGNLFVSGKDQKVSVFLNGTKVFENTYLEPWSGSVIIDAQTTQNCVDTDGLCDIEVVCSNHFVPSEIGLNADTRQLALSVRYIGGVK